jgi:spore maturation protein CgeB
MKFVLFYHSFVSCWNHGNAHFLRGVTRELIRAGHSVTVYEPEDGWSRVNALRDGGAEVLAKASRLVPGVAIETYRLDRLDLAHALDGADVAIAHEWNAPELVAGLSARRKGGGNFLLLFHDTHHRAVTAPEQIDEFDLEGFDGVLAFGEVLREVYRRHGWGSRAFTWHEGADTALFHPRPDIVTDTDLVWIGNWGDGERAEELDRYLVEPVAQTGIRARIHGVRYPAATLGHLRSNGLTYAGWLPNHRVPETFAAARVTIHVPRRPYVERLPGIPTIRMFEALACGIPLISAPWHDTEGLFPDGCYLRLDCADEMSAALQLVLRDQEFAGDLASNGLRAIRARHTCAHRVRELLTIVGHLSPQIDSAAQRPSAAPDQVTAS